MKIEFDFNRKHMQIMQGLIENRKESDFDYMTDEELVTHCLSKGLIKYGIKNVRIIDEEII